MNEQCNIALQYVIRKHIMEYLGFITMNRVQVVIGLFRKIHVKVLRKQPIIFSLCGSFVSDAKGNHMSNRLLAHEHVLLLCLCKVTLCFT